jgi:hypothetical protein
MPAPDGPSGVNGEIQFAFEPPPASPAVPGAGEESKAVASGLERASAKKSKEGAVDARGWITHLKIARAVEIPDQEGDGRLKTTVTHEVVLERRPLAAANQQGGGQASPLAIPNPPPVATEANSWLVFEDPLGRFSFRHPQVLSPLKGEQESVNELHLADSRPEGGRDRLVIMLQPKDANAERQLAFHDPQHFQRAISQEWGQKKLDILRGPVGFLSGDQWDELKRKVYRMEAGLKLPTAAERDEGRVYVDYYLVDFGRGQTIIVESWTDRNDHVSFRNEAEAIIKSFEFGPRKPQDSSATSPPTSAPRPQ